MEWSVLATFAGVLVAAAGAAWAIVREQSLIRQLERVTAVLADTPEGSTGYEHLVIVRDDLARRFNETYRAPRLWGRAFTSWMLRIVSVLAAALSYVLGFAGLNALLPDSGTREHSGAELIAFASTYIAIGAVVFAIAAMISLNRSRTRRAWLESHGLDDADRPSV